jgi:outer membrane protein
MLRRHSRFRFGGVVVGAVASAVATLAAPARADTIETALVQAYQNNPTLNSQRAAVRATDENVPVALSGYRPRVSVNASGGEQSLSSTAKTSGIVPGTPTSYLTQSGYNAPYGAGATITQTLYNGFQTANRTRAAESQVFAARETLRATEQQVLLSAVTAYMNLLRDSASLAAGRSQVLSAQATYTASLATYRQVIGVDPGKLAPGTPVDRFSPTKLNDAIAVGSATHPTVATAQYNADVAEQQVKVAEGALLPTISLQGNFQQNFMSQSSLNVYQSYTASVLGQLSVPIYQGGAEYAAIRQAKETLGQKRIDLDTARDQVRQNVVQSWGQLDAGKANIEATQAQVTSSEIALNGVREEARVGQRTTLDVLNAQQVLVNARVALVTAQHDRVVASYTLLASVGRLSPQVLGLKVSVYNPTVHYHQVRDSWAGARTPSGR